MIPLSSLTAAGKKSVPMKGMDGSAVAHYIVDAEDYALSTSYAWSVCNGYASRKAWGQKPTRVYLHRLIAGAAPGDFVDQNRLNNSRENLRICSKKNNHRNTSKTHATSGFRGVTFHRARNKWVAYIMVDRKHIGLGYYDVLDDAKRARINGERLHFGEFAPVRSDQ